MKTVLLAAWLWSSGTGVIVSETTWTAGSAQSIPASFDGNGRLDITMRRGCGREAIVGIDGRREERC